MVLNGFPEKIMQLNDLLETPAFCNRSLNEIHQELNIPDPNKKIDNPSIETEPPAKKTRLDDRVIKCGCEGLGLSGSRVFLLSEGDYN